MCCPTSCVFVVPSVFDRCTLLLPRAVMLRLPVRLCYVGTALGRLGSECLIVAAFPRARSIADAFIARPLSSSALRLFSHAAASASSSPTNLPPLIVRHGIASRPLTWNELCTAVAAKDWKGMGRLKHVQEQYDGHRANVLKQWLSSGCSAQSCDAVLTSYFSI
jgi:hypothetical protein